MQDSGGSLFCPRCTSQYQKAPGSQDGRLLVISGVREVRVCRCNVCLLIDRRGKQGMNPCSQN